MRKFFSVFTFLFVFILANGQQVDTAKCEALLRTCEKIIYNNPDSVFLVVEEILLLDPNQTEPGFLSRAYRFLGIAHEMKGEFDQSMRYYAQARPLAERAGDQIQIGRLIVAEGIIFQKVNNIELALTNYLKALKIFKSQNYQKGISGALNNIGLSYVNLGFYEKAKQIYLEEISNSLKRNDSTRLSIQYCNISNVYHDLRQLDSAHFFIKKSIEIDLKTNNQYGLASSYQTLASVYVGLEKSDSALLYYRMAKRLNTENHLYTDLVDNLGSMALMYHVINQNETALLYLDSAYFIADSIRISFESKSWLNKIKIAVFKKTGNKDLELEYSRQNLALIDSMKNQDLKEMLLKFEISKQNTELENQIIEERVEREKLTIANSRQKAWLITIAALLLITILATVSLFQSWKLRSKYNEALESRTQELELDLENSKRMISVLAHDFRAPLASVALIFEHLTNQEIPKEEMDYLTKRAKKNLKTTLRSIDQLLFWISRDKKIRYPLPTSVNETIDQAAELHSIELQEKNIEIKRENLDGASVLFDTTQFQIICRNLIHNSLKFLEPNGTITIKYAETETEKMVTIEDNGPGIEPELLNQINAHEFHRVLPKQLRGSGLGLELIFDIVQLNNGSIKIESEVGKGTSAHILFAKKS
ncbi:MAG: tetratricopeptide repeat-containing sensor histidine kinase [Salibacteraceae bacterium]|nr:tetratricopeptide repeat-containing sensor histidine kinase [Salibacteraceae bacterium]